MLLLAASSRLHIIAYPAACQEYFEYLLMLLSVLTIEKPEFVIFVASVHAYSLVPSLSIGELAYADDSCALSIGVTVKTYLFPSAIYPYTP